LLDVPIEFVNLIHKGCPTALTLNVYSTPLTKVSVGFEPDTKPLLTTYALLPSFVTYIVLSINSVGNGLAEDDTTKLPSILE
jgi:hypothetical protein